MIEVYGLKSCDTCRAALKALEAAGRTVEVTDIRDEGAPEAALRDWLDRAGAAALVNRRSTTWRGLDDAERAKAETPEGALALLVAHPTLMKRPVIVASDDLFVGWTAQAKAALL